MKRLYDMMIRLRLTPAQMRQCQDTLTGHGLDQATTLALHYSQKNKDKDLTDSWRMPQAGGFDKKPQ